LELLWRSITGPRDKNYENDKTSTEMTWDAQEIYLTVVGSFVYLIPAVIGIKIMWDDFQDEKEEKRRKQEQNKKAS
jgi:hypothetical protein